jgi:hypothetical protein
MEVSVFKSKQVKNGVRAVGIFSINLSVNLNMGPFSAWPEIYIPILSHETTSMILQIFQRVGGELTLCKDGSFLGQTYVSLYALIDWLILKLADYAPQKKRMLSVWWILKECGRKWSWYIFLDIGRSSWCHKSLTQGMQLLGGVASTKRACWPTFRLPAATCKYRREGKAFCLRQFLEVNGGRHPSVFCKGGWLMWRSILRCEEQTNILSDEILLVTTMKITLL